MWPTPTSTLPRAWPSANSLFLGFDDAASLAVHIEQVVGKAKTRVEGELADGDAKGRMDVRIGYTADMPAR